SISKVKIDDIDQANDYNPIKMLQGRVPGVNISNASGTPGATPNIQVRGVGSINGGSKPLYVVDGIPAESYPNLNPADIESIEVLKDASAAAIYGSRANSGVVIITTKEGKSGSTKIDVTGRVGFGKLAKDIEMANATEYANAMQAAIDNYNVQMGQNVQFYRPSVIEETDWMKLITRETTKTATGSISMSGGTDNTNFYASFGVNSQEGFIETSAFKQYNLRTKVSHKISRIFKVNINIAGAASQYNQVEESSTSLKVLRTAREEQPWYGVYNEDGSYKVNGTEIVRHNPVMLINEEKWTLNKYHLSGIFSIDVTPFKGFKWTPQASLYTILDNTTKKLTEKHDARKNLSLIHNTEPTR
ncbi:MAG: TonB-dependent receptor plug domain-containing protein, partial [Muribaculaceae bacterium]|nr:TonB-dependent receptor plug domain-containing protein [Muribaculaceae bacterium]